MLKDYELTASILAGGLGGTRERLLRTIRRLLVCHHGDAQDISETIKPDCRSPSYSAAVSQALSDLNDTWQGRVLRSVRFMETERLFLLLKDRTLDALANNTILLSDYHRLAQCLNELKLDSAQTKTGLHL
ncbi:MAG: hypothetical protein LBE31_05700 [Deltaproteobacteria bacterium]|nr:hypothetical protein [Deltaproteobacteria bacterium]